MGAFTARVILTPRNAKCFYRKRSIPAGIFRCLEVGRPENCVSPIGECILSRHAQRSPIGASSISDAASEGISLVEGGRWQCRHPLEVLLLAVNGPPWDGHREAPSGPARLFVKPKVNPVNHVSSPDLSERCQMLRLIVPHSRKQRGAFTDGGRCVATVGRRFRS
jgi:hypothetical protein